MKKAMQLGISLAIVEGVPQNDGTTTATHSPLEVARRFISLTPLCSRGHDALADTSLMALARLHACVAQTEEVIKLVARDSDDNSSEIFEIDRLSCARTFAGESIRWLLLFLGAEYIAACRTSGSAPESLFRGAPDRVPAWLYGEDEEEPDNCVDDDLIGKETLFDNDDCDAEEKKKKKKKTANAT